MGDDDVRSMVDQLGAEVMRIYRHIQDVAERAESGAGSPRAEDERTAGQAAVAPFLHAVAALLAALDRAKEPKGRRDVLLAEVAALERELSAQVRRAGDMMASDSRRRSLSCARKLARPRQSLRPAPARAG